MKALVKYAPGNGNVEIQDVPEPATGPGQVKVEIAWCGVCGTDLHVMHDTFRNFPPVILGHEMAGTVVEVGKEEAGKNAGARPGEKVTILGATAVTCGQCSWCRTGRFIFCKQRRGMGHGVNGAFTKYVVVRPDQLYRVPEDFSLAEAALSEPLAACVQAVIEVTPARIGDTVLISGPGPIGLLCLKLLAAEGIRTIVAGAPNDGPRLAAAKAIGADIVVNVGERPLVDAVMEATGGEGADVAFECAGHPDSVRGCLDALRPMGRYTQVAICGREFLFPMDRIFYKQLQVTGSICYTEQTWKLMMKIFAQGRLRLNDLISAQLPISAWQTAFELCEKREALKVLMHPED